MKQAIFILNKIKQHLGKIQGYYQLSEKVIKAVSEFAVGRHVFSIGLPE